MLILSGGWILHCFSSYEVNMIEELEQGSEKLLKEKAAIVKIGQGYDVFRGGVPKRCMVSLI